MDCSDTAAVVGLRNRRLSAQQKLPKRVSFKDETWVIQIPACEESARDWRNGVVFTRNSVAGNSWKNRIDTVNRRASLETTLYAKGGQQSPQSTQTCRSSSSGHEASRAPYKSILKTSTPTQQRASHLNRTYLPARNAREVSPRHSLNNNDYFKHDPNNLLFPRDTKTRLEKPVLARSGPVRHSTITRGLGSEDRPLNNKTTRFLGQDYSFKRTSSYNDLHHSERPRVTDTAKQPQVSFDVVGVTYGRVDKMPYFYDISGIMTGVKDYTPVVNSPNDRARLEHSSVSTMNQFDARKEGRRFSAIPAIAAFNKKTRGTRKHFPSAWTNDYDSSPKRHLPIAWQPAKQYNFSTR